MGAGSRPTGVMLETQNVNVPACQLYARCGFVLGGFDAAEQELRNPEISCIVCAAWLTHLAGNHAVSQPWSSTQS